MTKRPNILFLMSDQHRYDVSGFAGDDVVRTPTLDRLAETGVVFNNAYTPAPICIPARQCMMSGQLPKTCGCEGWIDLKPGSRTLSREFSRYAYNTIAAGKLHHIGLDQMQGWRERVAGDVHISDAYVEDKIEEEFARYHPAPGTGKWSNERELKESCVADGPCQQFDRRALVGTLERLTRYFQDPHYLRPESHRPLLYKLSFLQPHYPFFTTQENFDHYYDRVPLYIEEPCDHPVLSLSQQNKPVNVTEEDIRRTTATYYGMADTIDGYYGQVLSRLESLGENLDDWIIIYTADHGEMLGQHGIWEKTRMYEASVRIPMIIRWPAMFKGGTTVDQNVNLCDLFATLCELADIATPSGLDSRSLVPLMEGHTENWNNESISELGDMSATPAPGKLENVGLPSAIQRNDHVMIKQDALKYQYYGESIPEVLFDLDADPGELVNVAQDLDYAGHMIRFRTRLAELGFGPNGDSNYINAGYGD